ncbi:hypothetical protein JCM1393_15940 [Clostridium carnis]
MKHKRKAKKGMTLIEVIISVTLLSILIIPLSGLVMTTLKTNKMAEYSQKATYIGQSLLEEIKSYNEIKIKTDPKTGSSGFYLLDNDFIKKDNSKDTFSGNFQREYLNTDFNVYVYLEKDLNLSYESKSQGQIENELKQDYEIKLLKSNNINVNTSTGNIGNDIKIEFDINSNLKIFNNNDTNPILNSTINGTPKNKILISLSEDFKNIEENIALNINIDNKKEERLDIYIKKNKNTKGKVNIASVGKGNIKVYENISDTEKNNIGDLYKIKVVIKKGNSVVFEGEAANNIIFK